MNLSDKKTNIKNLCRELADNTIIDPALYQKYHVKRGLRKSDGTGVVAGITNICNVHGYVLNEGEVVLTGSPSEVFSQKEIIKKASLELPVATSISLSLREMGYNVDFSLTDKQLAESICKLK